MRQYVCHPALQPRRQRAIKRASRADKPLRLKRCFVCGKTRKVTELERICLPCLTLSPKERGILRAKRKPKGRRGIWFVSGGLPSLGKRR